MKKLPVFTCRSTALVTILAMLAFACGGPARETHDGSSDGSDATHLDGTSMLDAADAQVEGGHPLDVFDGGGPDVLTDVTPDVVDAGCTSNAACAGDPGGHFVCDTSTGRCVGCVSSADTCATGMYCDGTTDRCVAGCRDDAECLASTSDGGVSDGGDGGASPARCDTTHHICVQCLGDADCPSGTVCSGDVCSPGCNAGHACPTGLSCCGSACVDEQSNVANCGACTHACSAANAMPTCATGACAVGTCTAPFADCDGIPGNGCEVDTSSDSTHCGGCATACTIPANATAICTSATCGYTCNAGFADCDGLASNGCEVNLNADPNHCGRCTDACTAANATAACSAGVCAIGTCNTGYTDCNGNAADGCETATQTDPNHCGACSNHCTTANGTAGCTAGVCSVGGCSAGFADCDGLPSNGCETATSMDVNHCGSCAVACATSNATPNCATGVCGIASCAGGYADCNANPADGCEVNVVTSPTNCGACGTVCSSPNATPSCASATCTLGACNAGFANCDSDPTNGCEVNTNTSNANCGGCNARCITPNATAVCMGGTCAIGACNAGYADCDHSTATGCEVNTNTSVSNCGVCGMVCITPNATPACSSGACGIAACNTGFRDCDFNPADGCEINALADPNNCGGCGSVCVIPNGTAACTSGVCAVGACNAGFSDCDGNPSNGCETATGADPNNCGTCGRVCSEANGSAGCAAGSCTVAACNGGYQDCDHSPANGCEVNTNSNVSNCGACGRQCFTPNGTPWCTAGACAIAVCNGGYADCDRNPADGCEVVTASDPNNCGGCGNACAAAHANTTCGGSACVISSCAPNYFNVNGVESDGCECAVDALPRTCTAAGSSATLTVGAATSVSGNVPATTVSDWFEVTFTGNTNRAFHPQIQFTTNPSNVMRFDVYATCGGLLSCGTEGGVSSALTQWEQLYTGGGLATDPGFNAIPLPGSSGTVWIRVWRNAAAPAAACGAYALTISE